jgi:hypothetical protein
MSYSAFSMIRSLKVALVAASVAFQGALLAGDDAYAKTAAERAGKITAKMAIADSAAAARVTETIVRQYRELHAIHSVRDAAVAEAKKLGDKAARDAAIAAAKAKAEAATDELHPQFLARLAQDLTPEQIDAVKDGMTYGVLPNTYKVYQQMLPDLTDEQKKQILAWLTEAREKAMDAGSSEEKHAWFGKYKGKINNYLSKAGIDMKAAEKNLRRPKAE